MELHVTGELEAKLTDSAAKRGRNPDELVQDLLTRYFEEEARFVEAVKPGDAALERGEYLTHEQVGERLRRFLRRVNTDRAVIDGTLGRRPARLFRAAGARFGSEKAGLKPCAS
jgi:predicted transcriptional regulator